MKKSLIAWAIVLAAGCCIGFRPAQAGGVYDGVEPGSSVLGVRLGVSNLVGANVTYDYSLARVWKGSFTIGGQIGYMWNGDNWIENASGVRTVFRRNNHYLDFKIRTTYRFNVVVPEWEVYAGVGLGGGIDMRSGKDKVVGDGGVYHYETYQGARGFFSGAFILGTSYYFTDAIGANLEFDFGTWNQAWVNLGLNFKF